MAPAPRSANANLTHLQTVATLNAECRDILNVINNRRPDVAARLCARLGWTYPTLAAALQNGTVSVRTCVQLKAIACRLFTLGRAAMVVQEQG